MSPVPTSNGPTIGYTSKLGFDPIAARNPDRPKFRLDDYEVKEPREAEAPRRAGNQSDTDRKTETPRNQHRSENAPGNAKETKSNPSGNDTAGTAKAQAGKARAEADVQTSTAQDDTSKSQDGQSSKASTNNSSSAETPAEEVSADTPAPDTGNAEAGITDQSPEETATATPSAETEAPSVETEVSAPAGATVPASAPVPAEKEVTPPPTETTAQDLSKETPIAANVEQDEPAKAVPATTSKDGQKGEATPAVTSKDPKLAALEKLTQTGQSAEATTPRAASGDDTTTFKLPVPWPPQTQSEAAQGSQTKQSNTAGQANPAAQMAASHSQPAAPAQINQTTPVPEQAKIIPAAPKESLPTESNRQAAVPAAAKPTGEIVPKTGETVPKIEIISQAPAKPASTTDAVLIANNRTMQAEGAAKPAVLPTPSETIAAATALNSRPAQSNALGGSNAKRSNAVTASNENNGTKATANQGQQTPTIVSQTNQTNPAATSFAAATPLQSAVTTPEQLASVRQQSSSAQRGQTDQSGTPSSTSRPADLPAQGTGSGFADSLRTASADRTAATQDRQTLPTPATEQVKVKLVKAALGGLDKIKIQLNPSELGKVEVRLEIGSDGAIRGTVIADKPETMELLQRDAKQLERALQDAGLKTGGDSLDFQMRGGGTNERQQNAGSGNGPLSQNGGDPDGSDEQPAADTSGSEHEGIGDDGSLNLVA